MNLLRFENAHCFIRDGAPQDEYDDVCARAARVLIDGWTEQEATDVVVDVFRTDWGVSLGRHQQRQIAKRLRAAAPRLMRVRFPFLRRIP